MTDINPTQSTDLSREAIEARRRQAKLERAAGWARAMNRTFKGITTLGRRDYIERAIVKEGLLDD